MLENVPSKNYACYGFTKHNTHILPLLDTRTLEIGVPGNDKQ